MLKPRLHFTRLFFPLLVMVASNSKAGSIDLSPLSGIEISRLSGKWYEIARLPNRRQRGMIDVTHSFTLTKDNGIVLVSQGRKERRGRMVRMKGTARIPEPGGPARLKMKFYGLISFEYSIVECDRDNFQYIVVSAEEGKYLWVLSRTPDMGNQQFQQITGALISRGINVAQLERTQQDGAAVVNR